MTLTHEPANPSFERPRPRQPTQVRRRVPVNAWLVAVVLVLASRAAVADYRAATLSADGAHLVITDANGSDFPAPRFGEQVGFGKPRVSPDGKSVGWLALYPNCCTSYPIPLRLVILDHERRLHTFDGIKIAVFKWCFLPKSSAVAYMQTVLHGSNFEHFEARAISNGRLLGEYEYPDDETENATARQRAPRWVRCVEQ